MHYLAGLATGDPHGRDADAPTRIPLRGWWDIAFRIWRNIGEDRLLSVAAGMTFYTLLAIFPAIAAFVSLYGLLASGQSVEGTLDYLRGVLPPDALDLLADQMRRLVSQDNSALSLGFFISLGFSLWSSNASMKALFDALSIVYHEREKRGFFLLTGLSLTMTLGGLLFIILALSCVVVLPIVLSFVGLGFVTEWVMRLIRWPLLFAAGCLFLTFVYRYGPSRRPAKWRWISLGSIVAVLLWIIASMAFSYYVANFGSYNRTYGSLGAVVGFMTWIWISSIIILIGAELNAEIEHQTSVDSTIGKDRPLGERGATMADSIGPTAGEVGKSEQSLQQS
ncbi:YihY/virulence factor BrkB family protein [Arboricoccus pini]|nr:YihY/virulence factor BrkB family protein [Arboricoccus pini]